jgi:hypothetical protein
MKCPQCRKNMMWTGDHDSDEDGQQGLMVSWLCVMGYLDPITLLSSLSMSLYIHLCT